MPSSDRSKRPSLDELPNGRSTSVGELIEADDGSEALFYTVTDIADDKAVLDANHPLAGMSLEFHCKVIAVRPATADEIALKAPLVSPAE